MSDRFEEAFSHFLEDQSYEDVEDAVFTVVRAAYIAGWVAAGGEPPRPSRTITIPREK